MTASINPFTVLSYVSGPALLTNSTALLLMSTSNRFARAVDRSRELAAYLEGPGGPRTKLGAAQELALTQRRVQLIGRAMARFYLATSMFAMATMISIVGAVLGDYITGVAFDIIIAFAGVSGLVGFSALVIGAVSLTLESRTAIQALSGEADEALEAIERALHPPAAR